MVVRIQEGGTGQTTAPGARIALGLSDQNIIDIVTPSFGGPYQPEDADLTAIAALTTTSYGRSLLTLTDSNDLANEISANYQPLDSDLTAIAGLTTTSYGRDFLTIANAAGARTYLGLGTMATETAADYLTVATAASTYLPLAGGTMTGSTNFSLAAGNARFDFIQTAGSNRWSYGATGTAEGGANAGSNFQLNRYDDSGVLIGDALTIFRDDALAFFSGFVFTTVGYGVDTPVNSYKGLSIDAAGNSRWFIGSDNNTESGSDAGARFVIERYSDAGGFLGTPFMINRDSGLITLGSGQLKFPATANPSSDVNVLDDYEEGTWTGTVTPDNGGTFGSVNFTNGRYTKIGRIVHITGRVNIVTVGTAANGVRVAGLPFTTATAISGIAREQAIVGTTGSFTAGAGVTQAVMYTYNAGSFIAAGAQITFQCTYEV